MNHHTFGYKLRKLRNSKALTQTEVAKKLNLSYKVLSNYELDRRQPDFETLVKICDYFNVTIDYMLNRTNAHKHYKEAALDTKSEKLLYLFEKLPDSCKNNVLHYVRINAFYALYKDKLSDKKFSV